MNLEDLVLTVKMFTGDPTEQLVLVRLATKMHDAVVHLGIAEKVPQPHVMYYCTMPAITWRRDKTDLLFYIEDCHHFCPQAIVWQRTGAGHKHEFSEGDIIERTERLFRDLLHPAPDTRVRERQ